MSVPLLLLAFVLAVGWVLPGRLAATRWAARAPRAAIASWAALIAACAVGVAMAVHWAVTPEHHGEAPMSWLLRPGAASEGLTGHGEALALGLAALAVPGVVVAAGWQRAARARTRHREALELVARPGGDGWWVLEGDRPAAWCVPGRGGRVVLTRAAAEQLSPERRAAVLAHERAHLAGRHHLLTVGATALGRALPWLPAAKAAAAQVPLLVEMAADDVALRRCEPRLLAEALCVVAAGRAPVGGLGAGGHAVVARVQRLLAPGRGLPVAARGLWWVLAVLLPAVPVLVGCGP
ncbi:M56 family metallopeptidase [Kitasatospora sp. McL0602]|uniref:M56 family metallopeptidase n=1 Tax=Kitasatospora sp. McL0602 TaxID=3439530 RepID=UPI003F8B14F0